MIDVIRFGEMVSIDGLMVYQNNEDEWLTMNGQFIGSVRMTALFEFLHEEIIAERKRFHNYVDNILNKLIYN